MNRLEDLKPGARVRHIDQKADIEGEIVDVKGDWVFVQVPGGGAPQQSLMGFWEVIQKAPASAEGWGG